MSADLEALILSGEFFNPSSRSSSPVRSVSPSSDKGWHDEELDNSVPFVPPSEPHESIGMGPGRTGVKGVIRDRDEAVAISRAKKDLEMEQVRTQMEKSSLAGLTYLEEEELKFHEGDTNVDPLVFARARRDVFGRPREGRFGHLREVGIDGFVSAVENEAKGVWVVVHLYEQSLDRCYVLDDTLSRLARTYSDTKFLRCKASALGFTSASAPPKAQSRSAISRPLRTIRSSTLSANDSDDDDPYADDNDLEDKDQDYDSDDDERRHGKSDSNVDVDMLPTMLVYRDGELVHNWVRVDWEAGRGSIEELLEGHNILPRSQSLLGTLVVDSDGEDGDDDFLWGLSDDDEPDVQRNHG